MMHDMLFDNYPLDFKKAKMSNLGDKYEKGTYKTRINEERCK
jgi:hypothetical protein